MQELRSDWALAGRTSIRGFCIPQVKRLFLLMAMSTISTVVRPLVCRRDGMMAFKVHIPTVAQGVSLTVGQCILLLVAKWNTFKLRTDLERPSSIRNGGVAAGPNRRTDACYV